MNMHERFVASEPVRRSWVAEVLLASERAGQLAHWIRLAGQRLTVRVQTCADYWAAAAMYEQLSALSDAQLARRGLSRATLAQDVRAACDRSADA